MNWFKERRALLDKDVAMVVAPMDLRGLPAPEPMLRLLERIAESDGPHVFLLPFAPTPILPLLESYGWDVETRTLGDAVEVTLVRSP